MQTHAKPRSKPKPDETQRRAATDAQLRETLLRAKAERQAESSPHDSDITQQDLHTSEVDTAPSVDALGDMTMPVGRKALSARDVGTNLFDDEPAPQPESPAPLPPRPRYDTPRVQQALRPRLPEGPPQLERPTVDEPTYAGPTPNRAPHITPGGSDLTKFLQPGNYQVRVDNFVYEPVSETELVRLLNAGVFFAIDELRPEDGEWVPISSPELFANLRQRLAHRAHHMLAKVTKPRPASEFDRPAPPSAAAVETVIEAPEVAAALRASAGVQPRSEPQPRPKPRGRYVVPALALTAVAIIAVFAGVNLADHANATIAEPVEEEVDDLDFVTVFDEIDAGSYDPVPAFQSATAAVNSAHAVADSIDGMLVVANDENMPSATILAFEKWKRRPDTVEPVALAKKLMERELWKPARQVANWARVAVGDTPELQEIVTRSLREQFEDESKVDITAVNFAAVAHVQPGQRPTLTLVDRVGEQWLFWPDIGRGQWKNDIAAYRLCQIMVCHFRIEETREAAIARATLEDMVATSPLNLRETVESLLKDFRWNDGTLRGSIRRLPPGGVPWPIEATQVWRPWLTAGAGVANLDDNVEQAQQDVSFFGADRVYPEIKGIRGRQIARQVSSILLVDFLTNNWDRFASAKEDWGTRTHIDDGLIYSVADLGAFSDAPSLRVEGRFTWAKRFSRATIDSLRTLDEDLVRQYLFPDPSKQDLAKIDRLLANRRTALQRIDRYVREYGAEDVYAVDARTKDHR